MNRKNFMFLLLLICLLPIAPISSSAQIIIRGIVKDVKGKPIEFGNVFIKNSTDGSLTDSLGRFKIITKLQGNQVINASFVGYEQISYPVILADKEYSLSFTLKEAANMLDEIVISAGTIEANNERKVAILKPLDIVTIAGGGAEIINAIQALPGVQRNGGDQTGLLVRGGDVSESTVIIDGITAQNAFFSNVPGISQRSRFNPFQFKGTSFSSGGYSSRFGQALSSVLDLQTNDLPNESTINIGMNLTGISVSGSKLMNNNAIEYTGSYLNLAPYMAITKTNFDYYKNPQGGSFSSRWVSKVEDKGMFKMNFDESFAQQGITIPDPEDFSTKINFGNKNENTFFNMSYRFYYSTVDNSGSGYAKGFDIFLRDKKSIRNFEYWISYSFIDTKRLYQN